MPLFSGYALQVADEEPKQTGLQNLKKYCPHGAHKYFESSLCNKSNLGHKNKLLQVYIRYKCKPPPNHLTQSLPKFR